MTTQDAATAFTLDYLHLLERHLNIKWNHEGIPLCIVDWLHKSSIDGLRDDLAELMRSDLAREARQAAMAYGAEHVQTVGFGLAPDFDQFVKLGLLYGERVVLWDVIHSRMLGGERPDQDRRSLLAQIACNLSMLRPIVQRGAAVILPHPIVWSPLAATIDAELRASGPVPAASLGLSMAFAAIEEGIPLHPYALLENGAKPDSAAAVGGRIDELFSAENFRFQQCLTRLLRDQRLAYLQDVRPEAFLDAVSGQDDFRRALRTHFASALGGLSGQQARQETEARADELFELFEKRNAAVNDYAAEGIDATAVFVLASASLVALGQPLLATLAALGPLAQQLTTAVRKWAKTPEKNVIVQTFQTLDRSATPTRPSLHDMEYQVSHYDRGQSTLGEIFTEFMSFYWTEQKHHYLESLPPDIARNLLALLSPDDVEIIVNYRKFQEDYIGDYLAYLSTLDEAIYWEHLGKTFESPDGLLLYDDDAHIVSMETRDMPPRTWRQLLASLFAAYADEMRTRSYGYPLERFPDIVRFQTQAASDAADKRAALLELASSLDADDRAALAHFVAEAFDDDIPDWFAVER